MKALKQILRETGEVIVPVNIPIAGSGSVANEIFGPVCSNYHVWLKQIKAALDPQMASDPFFFVEGAQPTRKEEDGGIE